MDLYTHFVDRKEAMGDEKREDTNQQQWHRVEVKFLVALNSAM